MAALLSVLAVSDTAQAAVPSKTAVDGAGESLSGSSLSYVREGERQVVDPSLYPQGGLDVHLDCVASLCWGLLGVDLAVAYNPGGDYLFAEGLFPSLFVGNPTSVSAGASASLKGTILGLGQQWIDRSRPCHLICPLLMPLAIPVEVTVYADGRYSYTTGYFEWRYWELGGSSSGVPSTGRTGLTH